MAWINGSARNLRHKLDRNIRLQVRRALRRLQLPRRNLTLVLDNEAHRGLHAVPRHILPVLEVTRPAYD